MRTSTSALAILLSAIVAVAPLQAQAQHIASPSALEAARQEHQASQASAREDVLRVLEHARVKAVAEDAGIDLRQAVSAVSTLDSQDLAAVAGQAQQVETSLSGGQSRITVSTTMLIIGLLVLILLIVALK
jgi:hypothetical protein